MIFLKVKLMRGPLFFCLGNWCFQKCCVSPCISNKEASFNIMLCLGVDFWKRWCSWKVRDADATALGTGNQNTNQIVSGCASSGIAAKLCQDLVQGGYSDWFLPSSDELAKIYLNRVAIGGLTSNVHWTSTEASSGTAWILNFNDGIPNPWNKGANYVYVRAVRYF